MVSSLIREFCSQRNIGKGEIAGDAEGVADALAVEVIEEE